MPFTNFPQGFAAGLSVRGMPLLQAQPGQVFFVNNSTTLNPQQRAGSDNNRGTFLDPFATLANAISVATAARGDIIVIGAGHAETISTATALNLSTSGVAIIGLGSGSLRPTFTLDTATTSTITVSAANVSIQNCVFVANFLNIAALFTLTTAKDFAVDRCEFRDTSSVLNFLTLFTTNTTANAADGFSLTNSKALLLASSGVVNLLAANGTMNRVLIDGNDYLSTTTGAGAIIPIAAGKIITGLRLTNNLFNVVNAAGTATGYLITTNGSTNTGFIHGNYDHALPTTPLLVTASSGFVYGTNYHSDTADLSGYLLPAADS
jgi:hypothetical protein